MTERALYVAEFQARERPPTGYEDALADALEAAFAQGVHDLPAIVAALNVSGPRPADGGQWTETSFTAELRRLGATDAIGTRDG